MPSMSQRLSYPLCALLCSAFLASGAEGRLYRWVDEAGTVHYTDTLPPTQVERGHAEMNERGIVVGTTDPAKTLEEVQREREIKKVRDAAERSKKQQEAADRVLLRSFRSVDDMVMARDGKIASIDVMIQVLRSNIRRQQDWLRGLHADAANLERAGKDIPPHLSESIGKTEKAVRDAYAAMLEREQQKQEIYVSFAADIRRFRQLKELPEAAAGEEDKENKALQYVVSCPSTEACEQAWARATAYVRQHATTPIQVSGANMLITGTPETEDDVGITLSRVQEKGGQGASVFLDVQCKPNARGDITCTSPEALSILDGFQNAVTGPAADPAPGP